MSLEKKKNPMRIKDAISISNGFFSHIPYTFPEDITKSLLDIQFYSSYGLRNVAPIIYLFKDDDSVSQLTNDSLDTIGQAIYEMYHHKWDKQLAVYGIEYNPIYNYKDEYHETHSLESSDTKNDEWNESGSNTRTDDLSETATKGVSQLTTRTDDLTEKRILNTSSEQNRIDNLSKLTTNNLSEEHSGSVVEAGTRTDNLSQNETRNLQKQTNDAGEDNLYGYNSASAVGDTTNKSSSTVSDTGTVKTDNTGTQKNDVSTTDSRVIGNTGTIKVDDSGTQKNVLSNTGTDTTERTGTQKTDVTHSGSDITTQTGTQKDEKSNEGTKKQTDVYNDSGKKDYEHIGNIGNHPTQQLINDEIELWRWNFIQEVLNDVKEFTTLPVYLC